MGRVTRRDTSDSGAQAQAIDRGSHGVKEHRGLGTRKEQAEDKDNECLKAKKARLFISIESSPQNLVVER